MLTCGTKGDSHLRHMWAGMLHHVPWGEACPSDSKTVFFFLNFGPCKTIPVKFNPPKITKVPPYGEKYEKLSEC